nr:hypothetical protein [Tanacetum cinerariifolium]
MINLIMNGDQPLPSITQVSIARTSPTEQPPLKDKSMCNKTAKDLWDALARHMLGSEHREQDRKAAVLYDNKTAKDLWDALARHMLGSEYGEQDRKAAYATMMRQKKNLMDINIDALYNILKQNQGDFNDAMGLKKKTVVVTSDPLALIAEKMKASKRKEKVVVSLDSEGSDADDFSELKKIIALLAKDFNRRNESEYETSEYYDNTTTYGLFVNDNDDQEIFHDCENFPENLIESQLDHDESTVNHNDSERIDKLIRKFNKKIAKCLKCIEKANQQNKYFGNQNKDLQDKYGVLKNQATTFEMKNNELNEQIKVLIEKNNDLLAQTNVLKDQLQVRHVMIDTHVECQEKYAKLKAERYEYMIRYSAYFDNDKQHRKQTGDQEVLYDKMSVRLVELDKHVRDLKNMVLEKDFKISELEECVRNKGLEIEKCLERLNDCENKLHKMGQINQTIHMIMPSKYKMYNGQKGIGFENPSYFFKAKDLRPTLYDERVIVTPLFVKKTLCHNLGVISKHSQRNIKS